MLRNWFGRNRNEAPRSDPRHRAGLNAEELACEYLQHKGLSLVQRNFRCARGEIDLIMRDAGQVVFVEVRARRSANYGGGAASVDARKQAKLQTAAMVYLQQRPDLAHCACRFDVVAVSTQSTPPGVDWIPDAFQLTG